MKNYFVHKYLFYCDSSRTSWVYIRDSAEFTRMIQIPEIETINDFLIFKYRQKVIEAKGKRH